MNLNVSQESVIVPEKVTTSRISKSIASGSKEIILPLHLTLVRLHLYIVSSFGLPSELKPLIC